MNGKSRLLATIAISLLAACHGSGQSSSSVIREHGPPNYVSIQSGDTVLITTYGDPVFEEARRTWYKPTETFYYVQENQAFTIVNGRVTNIGEIPAERAETMKRAPH